MSDAITDMADKYNAALEKATAEFESDVNAGKYQEAVAKLVKATTKAMAELQMRFAGLDPDKKNEKAPVEPFDATEVTGLPVLPSGMGPSS